MKNSDILTKQELILTLKNIIAEIERDDSFEGRLAYPTEHDFDKIPQDNFEVDYFYRTGNSLGQGFVRKNLKLRLCLHLSK